jgi:hypothetical protein
LLARATGRSLSSSILPCTRGLVVAKDELGDYVCVSDVRATDEEKLLKISKMFVLSAFVLTFDLSFESSQIYKSRYHTESLIASNFLQLF